MLYHTASCRRLVDAQIGRRLYQSWSWTAARCVLRLRRSETNACATWWSEMKLCWISCASDPTWESTPPLFFFPFLLLPFLNPHHYNSDSLTITLSSFWPLPFPFSQLWAWERHPTVVWNGAPAETEFDSFKRKNKETLLWHLKWQPSVFENVEDCSPKPPLVDSPDLFVSWPCAVERMAHHVFRKKRHHDQLCGVLTAVSQFHLALC